MIHDSVPSGKINQTMKDWINLAFLPPPFKCVADSNGDLMINVTDWLSPLGAWGP